MNTIGCSICLEPFGGERPTCALKKCGHYYHRYCIQEWMHKNPTCPNCRVRFSPADFVQLIPSSVPSYNNSSGHATRSEEMELKYEEMAKKLELISTEKESLIQDKTTLQNEITTLQTIIKEMSKPTPTRRSKRLQRRSQPIYIPVPVASQEETELSRPSRRSERLQRRSQPITFRGSVARQEDTEQPGGSGIASHSLEISSWTDRILSYFKI